jgi:hypothetical protein
MRYEHALFLSDVSVSSQLVDHAGSLYPQFPQEHSPKRLTDAPRRPLFDSF